MKIFIAISLFLGFVNIAYAADVINGMRLAKSCSACHGECGISDNQEFPNLAGQKKEFLMQRMMDYKTYKLKNIQMNAMMQLLSERDMEDLAEYYASLKL